MLLPPPPPADALYPHAPHMPDVVSETSDKLLAKYERMLADQAPNILAALQPGLTDKEIDELEAKFSFNLTPDLRILYRWRNGTSRTTNINAFPDHEFIPLDQALVKRDALKKHINNATPEQQMVDAAYIGHCDTWLGLIVDLSGDGYFFDPGRMEAEGSFFFCFAEDGRYVFFPSFRNFLAAIVEGCELGVFKIGARGAETVDFEQAYTLWRKYGAENIR
ncbi:MAG: SMI1/KNR4 family protein [Thermoguttaceae bacterium]